MKVYQAIARQLGRIRICEVPVRNPNAEANIADATDKIEDIVERYFPHGSGFDSGTKFDFDVSHPNRLVFQADFHHMDEHGVYDGWTEHRVIVTPDLQFDFEARVTGNNRNDIKSMIEEYFCDALSTEIEARMIF